MSRTIKAVACADLRQGVTEAEHAVLDRADEMFDQWPGLSVQEMLDMAQRAAVAALRADPHAGNGRRRVERAREAAAMLITALNRMDADGREVRP